MAGEDKRIYELDPKVDTFTGCYFIMDKAGETEAVKVDYDTLVAVIKGSDLHAIAVTSDFFNTTEAVNALWVTQQTSFRFPYDGEIEAVYVPMSSVDTSATPTSFNLTIKGQAGKVFNVNAGLSIPANADGSGGVEITFINPLYNKGVQGDELLFEITAGANADAGDGMIYLKIKRT